MRANGMVQYDLESMSRQDILEVTHEGSIERELFEQIELDRCPGTSP
jgi:hypothetical protein